MMKIFEFAKYFFDVLTEEKDYLVFFISVIRIGKKHYAFLQIHYRESDSRGGYKPLQSLKTKLKLIDNQLNKISFKEGTLYLGTEFVRANFTTSAFSFDLKYIRAHYGSDPVNPVVLKVSKSSSLSWAPVQLKGLANGNISFNGNDLIYYSTNGYIDVVKSSILPVDLFIRKLFWGRLHHEIADLTYTLMINQNNKPLSVMILDCNGIYIEFPNFQYKFLDEKTNQDLNISWPEKIILTASNKMYSLTVEIINHEELILNEFMDPEGQYNKVFSRVVRRLSGNPKGIKFLASANVTLDNSINKIEFRNVSMISEYVAFYG